MKINEHKIKVIDLVRGYSEDETTSRIVAWGGNLDVRPEYQREYVYKEKERDAVINTVLRNFPLNIMYWVDRKDGTFEVLDGQQRIISLCRYYRNDFSVKIPAVNGGYNPTNFPNLPDGDDDAPEDYTKARFRNYELTVYICEGTDKEKLDWFQVINIAGVTLEPQEIRNALYHGPWLTDAKSAFSRKNCPAHKHYGKYMSGECIRQKYLETAFSWAAEAEGITGKDAIIIYMQKHRAESNADALWSYFEAVFKWVAKVFGPYDKFMKGLPWGAYYNAHKDDHLDPAHIQKQIAQLMADKEVERKAGIYEYLLTGEEKHLSLRAFDADEKATMYARQKGLCAICGKPFAIGDMHGDHITPWSKGGKTTLDNGQMLCTTCNLKKSNH